MTYLPHQHHARLPTGLWAPVGASPDARLNVADPPTSVFYETFSAALDTTDKWTVAGTAPSVSGGLLTMPTTGTSSIVSKPTFPALSSAHYVSSFLWRIEATAITGQGRFVGAGTAPTTPTSTSLSQDGVGFEVSDTGALLAVTYTGGVRTTVATLTRPSDAAYHRYSVQYRSSRTYWLLDDVQVATAANLTVVQDLPLLISQAGTATAGQVSVLLAAGVSDTNRNGVQIADGAHPHRRAKVGANGGLVVAQATSVGAAPVGLYVEAAAGSATDVLASLVKVTPPTTATGATSIAAATGKTLRLTVLTLSVVSTGATAFSVRVRLRVNPTGAAIVTSPILWTARVGFAAAPANGSTMTQTVPLPDGIEVSGTAQLALTHIGQTALYTLDATFAGEEYTTAA